MPWKETFRADGTIRWKDVRWEKLSGEKETVSFISWIIFKLYNDWFFCLIDLGFTLCQHVKPSLQQERLLNLFTPRQFVPTCTGYKPVTRGWWKHCMLVLEGSACQCLVKRKPYFRTTKQTSWNCTHHYRTTHSSSEQPPGSTCF